MKERFNPTNISLSLKLTLVKVAGVFFILLLIASFFCRIFFTNPHVSFAEFNQIQNEYLELEQKYDTLKEENENMKNQYDTSTEHPGGHIDVDLPHPGDAGQ